MIPTFFIDCLWKAATSRAVIQWPTLARAQGSALDAKAAYHGSRAIHVHHFVDQPVDRFVDRFVDRPVD
ncbi:MAG: hypothetical protein M3X11_23360, partial [Acidobacteriota bacterium]|nr:hypothetical protein [Acidobacteriota bacterium]